MFLSVSQWMQLRNRKNGLLKLIDKMQQYQFDQIDPEKPLESHVRALTEEDIERLVIRPPPPPPPNYFHSKFILGDIRYILGSWIFLWFPYSEMVQGVKILPCGRLSKWLSNSREMQSMEELCDVYQSVYLIVGSGRYKAWRSYVTCIKVLI